MLEIHDLTREKQQYTRYMCLTRQLGGLFFLFDHGVLSRN